MKFYLRDEIHTQFVTQNVKVTFSVHPALKKSGVTKYFFCCNTFYIVTIGNGTTTKDLPTIP